MGGGDGGPSRRGGRGGRSGCGRRGGAASAARRQRRHDDALAEVDRLKEWLAAAAPPRGTLGLGVRGGDAGRKPAAKPALAIGQDGKALAAAAAAAPAHPSYTGVKLFAELPISKASMEGLKACKYTVMTAVQRAALPHALCGRDVLGAAKTGSGKTLAFCIPLLEALYREQWSQLDGLGGLILTPTRELALQIFDELRKVGKRHAYSAGLLIGGKSVKEEQRFVNGMNILVATPGRLLQHMDETPGFDCDNVQVLVLDEADRILDMGFSHTINAILENLKHKRQTLLFSATQTRSVKDLARLSLHDPEYIAVHAETATATPVKLRQAVVTCEAHEKLDMLWSFVRSHLLNKTICFLSTCKQVRFVYEAFKRLRPGVPLRMLHGKMKQMRRMSVFYEFCEAKEMVLFATDIASRGLDFPAVDWVVQIDCPEDVAQYIHRVGRTARFTAAGHALMYITPSEEAIVQQLKDQNVDVSAIKVNPSKLQSVTPALQALVSKSVELKDLAQRALVSYLRSIFLSPNKAVFDVTKVNVEELSPALGLMVPPKLRFMKKAGKGTAWNAAPNEALPLMTTRGIAGGMSTKGNTDDGEDLDDADVEDTEGEEAGQEDEEEVTRRPSAPTQEKADAAPSQMKRILLEEDDDGDFLSVKRRDVLNSEAPEELGIRDAPAPMQLPEGGGAEVTGKKRKKMKIKDGVASKLAKRVVFDDEGNVRNPLELLAMGSGRADDSGGGEEEEGAEDTLEGLDAGVHASSSSRMKRVAELMKQRDLEDKQQEKLKRKQKKAAKKERARNAAMEEEDGAPVAVLGSADNPSSDNEDGLRGSDDERGVAAHGRSPSPLGGHEDGSDSGGGSGSDAGLPLPSAGKALAVRAPNDLDSMSMADQQALALQLLQRKRRQR